ncbi:MAG: type II toxin-antitoxin system VapC family toxin [Chloroflexota bacterium]
MTRYFLDSSALVKRYVREIGSAWVNEITEPRAQHGLLIAEIGIAEVAAAFGARFRNQQNIDQQIRERTLRRFLDDCDDRFVIVATDRAIIDKAVELTGRHRLRAYDAVQLASALSIRDALEDPGQIPPILVSADSELLEAGIAEGMMVENPLNH